MTLSTWMERLKVFCRLEKASDRHESTQSHSPPSSALPISMFISVSAQQFIPQLLKLHDGGGGSCQMYERVIYSQSSADKGKMPAYVTWRRIYFLSPGNGRQ